MRSCMLTKTDAKRIRKKLEEIVEEKNEYPCHGVCRECALISRIKARKNIQCILNLLQLSLEGDYDAE
jgi:hypothetical protein